jgi:hypothetical protein
MPAIATAGWGSKGSTTARALSQPPTARKSVDPGRVTADLREAFAKHAAWAAEQDRRWHDEHPDEP